MMCSILLKYKCGDVPVVIIKNKTTTQFQQAIQSKNEIFNMDEIVYYTTLDKLENEYSRIDYFTLIMIENTETINIGKNKLVTQFPDGKIFF